MSALKKQTLPWWTWVAPLLLCMLGALVAINLQIAPLIARIYWPVAFGTVMAIWWGPRALLGIFLSTLISIELWPDAQTGYAPLYAACDTLAAAAGWFAFTRLRVRPHLPTVKDAVLFTLTGAVPLGLTRAFVTAGLLQILQGQPDTQFFARFLLVWSESAADWLAAGAGLLVFVTPWLERRGWSLTSGTERPRLLQRAPDKAMAAEGALLFAIFIACAGLLPVEGNWIIFGLLFLVVAVRFGLPLLLISLALFNLLVAGLPRLLPQVFSANAALDLHGYLDLMLFQALTGYLMLVLSRQINRLISEAGQRQAAEEALRKANRLHETLLSKSFEVLSIVRADGQMTYTSPSVEKVRGLTAAELQAMPLTEGIHPDDLPLYRQAFARILSGPGSTETLVLRVLKKNGEWMWAEVHATNLCDDPDVGGIVVNYHDVSASHQAQDLTRRQHELGQALAEMYNLDSGLALSLDAAIELSGMDSGAIYLVESDRSSLSMRCSRGLASELVEAVKSHAGDSFQVRRLLLNQPIYAENLPGDPQTPEPFQREGLGCLASLPLMHRGQLLGALSVASHSQTEFAAHARTAIETTGAQMGAWIARLQAEEALQKSARGLQDSLRISRMASWEYDVPARQFILNDLFYQIIGAATRGAAAQRVSVEQFAQRYMDGAQADETLKALARAIRKSQPGQQNQLEFKLVRPNGQKLWVACWFRVEHDARGKPLRLIGIIQDISAAKQAEDIQSARLRLLRFAESHSIEELCQATLDELDALTESPIGFYHFMLPDQKTLALQSWSTRTVQEFCRAEGKGQHYDLDSAGVWADCVRQRRALIHNDYPALPPEQRKGLPPGHAEVMRELVVPVMRQGLVVAVVGVGNKPLPYTGEDLELVAHFADLTWEITERARTVQALQSSERKFREVVSASPNVIMILQDGRYVYANPAALQKLGYSEAELYELPVLALIHPDEHARVRARLVNAQQQRPNPPAEMKIVKKNGEIYISESASVAIEYNNLPATLIISQDITERRKAEEALQQRTAELGLLVISAGELSRSLNLRTVYRELYRFVTAAMPCDALIISTFSRADQLIRCAAAWRDEQELEIENLPPAPLQAADQDPHSKAIRTGAPLLLSEDEARQLAAPGGRALEGAPRSGLVVPLKLEDRVVGAIQVLCRQPNAYTDDHLWLLSALSNHAVIAMANSNLFTQAQSELEERRRAEAALRGLLDEKNALIKEIHHRVKNNMQVMISLLSLQSGQVADAKIRELFQESENRIRSMALVHEQLYRSSSLSRIDFGVYLESLTRDLHATLDYRSAVRLSLHLDSLTLPIETAVPCGLIVNELVTNAFKHAFPGGRRGMIEITLACQPDEVMISVADDGVGIPAEMDVTRLNSLGMKLIYLLASQVNGRLVLERTHGAKFSLFFKS